MKPTPHDIRPETAADFHPDSPLLTAYESGAVRYLRGMACPGGATLDLRRGYNDAMVEWPLLDAREAKAKAKAKARAAK